MTIKTVSLSSIGSFVRGVTFDKSQQESTPSATNLPLLRAGNIGTDLDLKCDLIFVPRVIVSSDQLLRKDDIVICLSSGSPLVVGKSAPLNVDWYGTVGAFCGIVRPCHTVDPEYLALWFRSTVFTNWRDEQARGANIQNLRFSELAFLEIVLPDREEQKRIASHLKAQLALAEEARSAALAQRDETVNLANAIIRQSVEHPETKSAKLGDVLGEVKKGIGKTWAEYPVLGATRAGLALAKEPVGKSPERYKPVMCGTVFYNPMRIMIGSIAMVDENDTPGITSPDYVALRGKPGLVDSRWFYYWLRSPYGVSCIASLARGAVRERMLFNRLADGNIELPPYDVQVAAAQALAELRPMQTAIKKQLNDINLLPAKILARAFDVAIED